MLNSNDPNELQHQLRALTEQNRSLLADNERIKDDYSDAQFSHAATMSEVEFNAQKESSELKSTLKFKSQELHTLNRQHTQLLREISTLKQREQSQQSRPGSSSGRNAENSSVNWNNRRQGQVGEEEAKIPRSQDKHDSKDKARPGTGQAANGVRVQVAVVRPTNTNINSDVSSSQAQERARKRAKTNTGDSRPLGSDSGGIALERGGQRGEENLKERVDNNAKTQTQANTANTNTDTKGSGFVSPSPLVLDLDLNLDALLPLVNALVLRLTCGGGIPDSSSAFFGNTNPYVNLNNGERAHNSSYINNINNSSGGNSTPAGQNASLRRSLSQGLSPGLHRTTTGETGASYFTEAGSAFGSAFGSLESESLAPSEPVVQFAVRALVRAYEHTARSKQSAVHGIRHGGIKGEYNYLHVHDNGGFNVLGGNLNNSKTSIYNGNGNAFSSTIDIDLGPLVEATVTLTRVLLKAASRAKSSSTSTSNQGNTHMNANANTSSSFSSASHFLGNQTNQTNQKISSRYNNNNNNEYAADTATATPQPHDRDRDRDRDRLGCNSNSSGANANTKSNADSFDSPFFYSGRTLAGSRGHSLYSIRGDRDRYRQTAGEAHITSLRLAVGGCMDLLSTVFEMVDPSASASSSGGVGVQGKHPSSRTNTSPNCWTSTDSGYGNGSGRNDTTHRNFSDPDPGVSDLREKFNLAAGATTTTSTSNNGSNSNSGNSIGNSNELSGSVNSSTSSGGTGVINAVNTSLAISAALSTPALAQDELAKCIATAIAATTANKGPISQQQQQQQQASNPNQNQNRNRNQHGHGHEHQVLDKEGVIGGAIAKGAFILADIGTSRSEVVLLVRDSFRTGLAGGSKTSHQSAGKDRDRDTPLSASAVYFHESVARCILATLACHCSCSIPPSSSTKSGVAGADEDAVLLPLVQSVRGPFSDPFSSASARERERERDNSFPYHNNIYGASSSSSSSEENLSFPFPPLLHLAVDPLLRPSLRVRMLQTLARVIRTKVGFREFLANQYCSIEYERCSTSYSNNSYTNITNSTNGQGQGHGGQGIVKDRSFLLQLVEIVRCSVAGEGEGQFGGLHANAHPASASSSLVGEISGSAGSDFGQLQLQMVRFMLELLHRHGLLFVKALFSPPRRRGQTAEDDVEEEEEEEEGETSRKGKGRIGEGEAVKERSEKGKREGEGEGVKSAGLALALASGSGSGKAKSGLGVLGGGDAMAMDEDDGVEDGLLSADVSAFGLLDGTVLSSLSSAWMTCVRLMDQAPPVILRSSALHAHARLTLDLTQLVNGVASFVQADAWVKAMSSQVKTITAVASRWMTRYHHSGIQRADNHLGAIDYDVRCEEQE